MSSRTSFLEPARFEVTLTNTGEGIVATGTAEATVRTPCVRCLREFELPVTGEVEGFYIFPGHDDQMPEEQEFEHIAEDCSVDIEPAVAQCIVVDLPFAPVHDADCKGICPVCGADRNLEACACSGETPGLAVRRAQGPARQARTRPRGRRSTAASRCARMLHRVPGRLRRRDRHRRYSSARDAATTPATGRVGRRRRSAMPVPKRKTGKAVRDSRRAHDHLTAPARSECPTVPPAEAPAHGVPVVRLYKGKEVVETD